MVKCSSNLVMTVLVDITLYQLHKVTQSNDEVINTYQISYGWQLLKYLSLPSLNRPSLLRSHVDKELYHFLVMWSHDDDNIIASNISVNYNSFSRASCCQSIVYTATLYMELYNFFRITLSSDDEVTSAHSICLHRIGSLRPRCCPHLSVIHSSWNIFKKLNSLLESVVLSTFTIRNANFILDQNPTKAMKRQTK